MRYRLECETNRYVFKSRLNCSESTAGSLRQSGSEFQTVGPATENARVPKVLRRTRRTNSWWRLVVVVVVVVVLLSPVCLSFLRRRRRCRRRRHGYYVGDRCLSHARTLQTNNDANIRQSSTYNRVAFVTDDDVQSWAVKRCTRWR